MSRPSMTTLPSSAELALALAHHLAHRRVPRDDRDHAVDRAPARIAAVTSVPAMRDAAVRVERRPGTRARARRARRPRRAAAALAARATSARGTSRRCRGSGSRAARRARVRRCSCRRRPGRRSQRSSPGHQSPSSSKNPGKLTARRRRPRISHAFARDEARDGAEHRDPVVAARRRSAAPRRVGTPRIREAVVRRADVGADGAERGRSRVSMRSRLLHAELLRAADDALAARAAGERARRAAARRRAAAPRPALISPRSARETGSRGRRPARRRRGAG